MLKPCSVLKLVRTEVFSGVLVFFEVGDVGYAIDGIPVMMETSKTKILAFANARYSEELLWEIKNWVYQTMELNIYNSSIWVNFKGGLVNAQDNITFLGLSSKGIPEFSGHYPISRSWKYDRS